MYFVKAPTECCSFPEQCLLHSIDERRSFISTFFEPRIRMLLSAADRREMHEMLYFYLQSKKEGLRTVFARLDQFEHKDQIVLSLLAAWKHLAQSHANDVPVDVRHIKKARTLRDMWLEHRYDWKLHKQQIFDAGQVHLVGQLVHPFLEAFLLLVSPASAAPRV
jgi:hypothetical protein